MTVSARRMVSHSSDTGLLLYLFGIERTFTSLGASEAPVRSIGLENIIRPKGRAAAAHIPFVVIPRDATEDRTSHRVHAGRPLDQASEHVMNSSRGIPR